MQFLSKVRYWWCRPHSGAGLLGLLLAVLLLAACKKTTAIGDALPSPAAVNRVAFFTDTITVRSSTVLVDSIPSSTAASLVTGRYVDPLFGTITARSYAEFALDAELVPDVTQVYDSLALEITANTYRYGDTTRVQTLEIHQIPAALRTTKPYYTKDDVAYNAAVLGQRTFRAGSHAKSLHIKLSNALLGNALWTAAQGGLITTQDQLSRYLNGLAMLPGAADNAAVVQWAATPVLRLYHHSISDPATVLTYTFTAGAVPHFFHLGADRTNTVLASLTKPGQALSSTLTGNRSFVEAGLGLYTKLEFPYLTAFSQYGNTLVLNSAVVQLAVPTSTENRLFLALPTALTPQLVNKLNIPSTALSAYVTTPALVTSTRTNLEQNAYALNALAYIQEVLAGTVPNDGLLLNPNAAAGTVNRAAFGNTASTDAPLQLRMYYTRIVE